VASWCDSVAKTGAVDHTVVIRIQVANGGPFEIEKPLREARSFSEQVGKRYSVPVHECNVLRLKVEDHQPSIDLVDLTMETVDPRITETNITIRVSAHNVARLQTASMRVMLDTRPSQGQRHL
jgi:hypothetical protein